MKWMSLTSLILSVVTSACGSLTTTSTSAFKVRMQGVYSTPPAATGTGSPQSQTYLLKQVFLTQTDGTEVQLYEGEPATYKIIDRPQLIYANYDMSAYDAVAFSKVTVVLDPAVVVTTREGTKINVVLDSGSLEVVQAFTIDKAKTQTLTVKSAWGKTITTADDGTETAIAPTFSLLFTDD